MTQNVERAARVRCSDENPWNAACVDLLEKKNRVRAGVVLAPKKGEPAAPLRAFTFADGGAPGFHEQRAAPLFKIARALEGKSTTKDAEMFNRCVVMVDEAHLLAKPSANSELNQQQLGAVARLAKRLTTSSPRLVLATATPVIDEAKDADALMAIVHGTAPHRADEGFVSWFMSRPPSLFATSTPSANMIPHVVKVPLQGENLLTYKRELLAKTPKEKLQKYENSILFYYNDKAIDNLRAQLRLKHGAGASLARTTSAMMPKPSCEYCSATVRSGVVDMKAYSTPPMTPCSFGDQNSSGRMRHERPR